MYPPRNSSLSRGSNSSSLGLSPMLKAALHTDASRIPCIQSCPHMCFNICSALSFILSRPYSTTGGAERCLRACGRGAVEASLNNADPARIFVVESKQRLLGSDQAIRVIFSIVAEQTHGDAMRQGANRPVVAGEILGAANFAGLACATHQLLDLAALASVELWLAGVELWIERHDTPICPTLCATMTCMRLSGEPPAR